MDFIASLDLATDESDTVAILLHTSLHFYQPRSGMVIRRVIAWGGLGHLGPAQFLCFANFNTLSEKFRFSEFSRFSEIFRHSEIFRLSEIFRFSDFQISVS